MPAGFSGSSGVVGGTLKVNSAEALEAVVGDGAEGVGGKEEDMDFNLVNNQRLTL